MTRHEIARCLGLSEGFVSQVFRNAKKENSNEAEAIKVKSETSTVSRSVNYSLDEILYAMRVWNKSRDGHGKFTVMQELFIEENFLSHDGKMYVHKEKAPRLSRSAKSFLFIYKNSNGIRKVCCTCAFMAARNFRSRLHAYCNLRSKFLSASKVDIYSDRCPAYERTEKPPFMFTKDGGILNTDEKTTTLGIPNSFFTTGKSTGEPAVIPAIFLDIIGEENEDRYS